MARSGRIFIQSQAINRIAATGYSQKSENEFLLGPWQYFLPGRKNKKKKDREGERESERRRMVSNPRAFAHFPRLYAAASGRFRARVHARLPRWPKFSRIDDLIDGSLRAFDARSPFSTADDSNYEFEGPDHYVGPNFGGVLTTLALTLRAAAAS